jgi:uncharacterized phage-like protein YoqJ
MLTISFTGHRPQKIGGFGEINPVKDFIVSELIKKLEELKPDKCISGMAQGFDIWAAQTCVKMKIPFIAAVPFKGQENVWPDESKKIYHNLLDLAEEVVIVSTGGYAIWKLQVRNQWMVDNSDEIIACFDGSPGGTKNCIVYATNKNKKIYVIDPTMSL